MKRLEKVFTPQAAQPPAGTLQWYVMENAFNGWRVQGGPFNSEIQASESITVWMRKSPHYKIVSALYGETPVG